MGEQARGFIGNELEQLHHQQEWIADLQSSAENILLARSDAVVEQYGRNRWHRLDRHGQNKAGLELIQMLELATDLRSAPKTIVVAELSAAACQALIDGSTEYQESLPYASAECRWLGGLCRPAHREAFGDGYAGMVEWIMGQQGEIVSGGRHMAADGRELMNRGWDWMRGAGKFKDNSTYEVVTRNALCRIANLFDRNTVERQLHPELADFEL